MNKKTIHQLEAEIAKYWRKLYFIVQQIRERQDLIKKIRMGKVKQPPPKGKKVYLQAIKEAKELNDELPSFGGNPNTSFD